MLQEDPFFSQPIIFYGSHEENEEEELLEHWQIGVSPERFLRCQHRIGLFFHWFPQIE